MEDRVSAERRDPVTSETVAMRAILMRLSLRRAVERGGCDGRGVAQGWTLLFGETLH